MRLRTWVFAAGLLVLSVSAGCAGQLSEDADSTHLDPPAGSSGGAMAPGLGAKPGGVTPSGPAIPGSDGPPPACAQIFRAGGLSLESALPAGQRTRLEARTPISALTWTWQVSE